MTVKRYGTSCAEREGGIFVKATDFDAVEAERDALRAECERLRADAARYDFLRSRAEMRAYDMGHYWHIKTIDVPMGMPAMAAMLSNVIDVARAKEQS